MKKDKKTQTAMADRLKWLNAWLRGCSYDIGDKRRDFIFFYYCTLLPMYSPQRARELTLEVNSRLAEPLDDYAVNSTIRTVNKKRGYMQKNRTIIDVLGITPAEVETLRIGHNLAEQAAREQRRIDRLARDEQIITLYKSGYRITEISVIRPDISKRTIERVIAKASKQQKQDRDADILRLDGEGYSVTDIAKEVGCSQPTVRNVLKRKKSPIITRTEVLGSKSAAPSFVDPAGQELFSRYKEEVAQANRQDFNQALSELQTARQNVCIVGTGGTGKTQLIKDYLAWLSPSERSNTLVVAPTGLAASHIDGLTVHKAFGLQNEVQTKELPQSIPQELMTLQRVIIDEISMLRIDIFERIITILQSVEAQQHRKIQLIVLGDFGQLQPVCTKEDGLLLRQLYPNTKGIYAFHSELWEQMDFQRIVLKYNFRQEEQELADQLAALKYGSLDAVKWFNDNCCSFYDMRAVHICPRNEDVDKYNQEALEQFEDEDFSVYQARSQGLAENAELPCPQELRLSVGMRIMTIVNDRKYKNGSIGTITELKPNIIRVRFDNGAAASVCRKKFTLPDGSVFEQLPIVLAYAFTVHKCQGCTFDYVAIVPGFFAAGQLYTALSRCKSLEGIYIEDDLTAKDVIIDVEALKMTI